jgi:hypothetical protein
MFIEENRLIDTLRDTNLYNIKEIEQRANNFYNKFCFLLEANKAYTSRQIAQIAINFSQSEQTKLEASLFYHLNKNKTFKFDYYKGTTVKEKQSETLEPEANSFVTRMKKTLNKQLSLSVQ